MLAIVERGEEVYQDLIVISEFGDLTDLLLVSALQVHPKVLGLLKYLILSPSIKQSSSTLQDESWIRP